MNNFSMIMQVLTSYHRRSVEHPGCQCLVGEEQEAVVARGPEDDL